MDNMGPSRLLVRVVVALGLHLFKRFESGEGLNDLKTVMI